MSLLAVVFAVAFGLLVLVVWPIHGLEEEARATPASSSASEPLHSSASGGDSSFTSAPPPQTAVAPQRDRQSQAAFMPGIPSGATTTQLVQLQAFSGLPLEVQEEVARELGREADFTRSMEVFSNPGTPASVSKIIFDAALNRPNEMKLPFLAEIADSRNHLLRDEARDFLVLYLDLKPKPGAVPPGGWGEAVGDYLNKHRLP
jgi:hypothetical protein